MKIKKCCMVLFLSCLLFSGCHPNNIRVIPLGVSDMTPVHSSQPIKLINTQEAKVIDMDVGTTNLTEWSDTAIKLIEQWFNKTNIQLTEAAEKYLRVSISDVFFDDKTLNCTQLTLNIETSTGIQRSYPAKGCASGQYSSASYAINYAVVDLMHDGTILNYIEN
jgi:hypothetical protein